MSHSTIHAPRPRRFAWLVLATLLFMSVVDPKAGQSGAILVSPHDEQHLVPLGPSDFRDEHGAAVKAVADRAGAFDQTALVVDAPLVADLKVRHAGKYALWVRVGRPADRLVPIQVRLTNQKGQVLAGAVNDDAGSVARGGPQGRKAYQEQAKKNTPAGAVPSLDAKNATTLPDKKGKSADDLSSDILGDLKGKKGDPWVNLLRVEELLGDTAFYWWKLGPVELPAGHYRLRVEPTGKLPAKAADRPRVDAAFLTTNDKLFYPYAGDIGHFRATFVRFRIDKLPKEGMRIAGAFQTHVLQHPRLSCVFGPGGLAKEGPHTRSGFTCWYRLQDIAKMPDAGPREIGMQVSFTSGKAGTTAASGYAGATQFAAFPHPDFVVREFDWLEPTGLAYTVPLDCETYAHRLMNFRDHAREHYEMALAAADRINPLTRGELYFTGMCGAWNADDRDYMRKTMRLMGFNSVSEAGGEPLAGRKQYGWAGAEFVANLPLGFPLDEAKSRQEYEDYFRKLFAEPKTVERWRDARSFCMSDEPGEAYRAQMTAPVWQYHEENGKSFWLDPIGSSELYTRPADMGDCVLEGVGEHTGRSLDFHVGVDDPQQPTRYWYWRLGYPLGPALNANLAFGEHVEGQPPQPGKMGLRMVQSLGNTRGLLRFKIVQQKGTATLFINGKTVHQHKDLPKKVCFGIAGGTKRIYELRLRPLRPGEGVAFEEGESDKKKPDTNLEDFGLGNLPAWAKAKPLRRAVEEDWIEAGGDAAVKDAFRRWARERGLTPATFGAKDWQQVRPLTMPGLVRTEDEARLFYWSRRFSGQLTPRRFEMISDAVAKFAPNPDMWNYAALSGGALYRSKEMPVDMFALAGHGNHHTGGISDWMFYSTWRWDSHQAVAYSAELFNAGARRHGQRPVSFPMMHCVSPTIFRAYTQVANQVKILSLYDYGPHYLNMPDSWSQNPACYQAVSLIANRAALCDDILSPGLRRPSRVALLYAHSTEYWNPTSSFDDKRSTFLGLSHEYFQPEVVTEQQVLDGALKHYDALYVLDPNVSATVQTRIGDWVKGGGLVWACANALTRDEYNRPADLLHDIAGMTRTEGTRKTPAVRPEQGTKFRPHSVIATGMPGKIDCPEARVLARYDDGGPAWLQKTVAKGKVVYVGHRAGSTYASKNIQAGGYKEVWADTGRELLTAPLHEAGVARSLVLSEPAIVAAATDTNAGSVVILYNMKPTPRRGLVVRLREEKPPHSVETFDGLKLRALPFEHKDGWVSATLDNFDEGQMIVVWRQPKPADDRLEQMRQRTLAQLESKDADVLSTGAWFAGFFPEWNCGDRIVALLDHPSWMVRRSAAEAVGRLRHGAARDRLWTAAQTEADAHVLADQLAALAILEHPGIADLARRTLGHRHFLVRRQALRALSTASSASKTEATTRDAIVSAAHAALADHDQRVRREAIALIGRFDAQGTLAQSEAAFRSEDAQAKLDRPLWGEAVAANDAAFAQYLQAGPVGEHVLCLAVAKHRRDPKLANMLVAIAPKLPKDLTADWVAAAVHQRSQDAARKLFAMRAELPEGIRSYLPLILEHSFDAGRGQVLSDWEEFLAGRGGSSQP